MLLCATMLSFKTVKSRNLAALKFKILRFLYIYMGTMTALLLLTVILIVDHTYFVFTQHIILRTKKSKRRKNFTQSSPSKYGLNDNATFSKIIITYRKYSYYLNYSHDHITYALILTSFSFSIFWFLEGFPLPQPFLNKLSD
jgi:hypothetical protein